MNNRMSLSSSLTVAAILFFVISSICVEATYAIYTFRLSGSCNPACQGDETCVQQTRNCSHSNCPTIIYCVNVRYVPRRYRQSLQALLTTPSPRTGCPARLINSPCITQCQKDSSCRPGHLCCFNGCGHVCVPDLTQPYRPKSGFCPERSWNSNPSCQSNCDNDYECRGHRKCCQTSCGNKCTHPCFYWLTDNHQWRLPPGCRGPAR